MPVIVTTPEPCPLQSETMQALGFRLLDNEGGTSCTWSFTGLGNLAIQLPSSEAPTTHQAVAIIIKTALQTGESRRAAAIAKLLKA